MSETIFEPGSELAKVAKIGEDLETNEINEQEAGAELAEENLKGNVNLGGENTSGTIVEAAEKAVENVTDKDADTVYKNAQDEISNSSSSSSSSSSGGSNSNNDPQGLVQPPADSNPVEQPTTPAPVVNNPAKSNENIDMGITSTGSAGNSDSDSDSDRSNNANSMVGGIDSKIILGAVVIAAVLMR